MTLDEAIKHAEAKADELIYCECAKEHRQLAEWLRELKRERKMSPIWSPEIEKKRNEFEHKQSEKIKALEEEVGRLSRLLKESENREKRCRKVLKEARDALVMTSLIDKSDLSKDTVEIIEKEICE